MLEKVIGQEFVKTSLLNLLHNNSVPHALLFYGENGVGKEAVAIEFAQLLTGRNKPNVGFIENEDIKYICALPRGKNETDSDGPFDKLTSAEFESIKKEFLKKSNNLYYTPKIDNANDIKINSVRDISKFLAVKTEKSQNRVIIIADVELMNETSQNALLKNLEEPPPNVFFLLTTHSPQLLRETIRSRCQGLHFSPLADDQVSQVLREAFQISTTEADFVSRVAQGSYKNALSLIEADVEFIMEKTISVLRYGLAGKYYSCLKEVDQIVTKEGINIAFLLTLIIYWLYELQLIRNGKMIKLFAKYVDTIEKFNSRYNDVELRTIINQCEALLSRVKSTNVNSNIVKLRLVILLSSILKIK